MSDHLNLHNIRVIGVTDGTAERRAKYEIMCIKWTEITLYTFEYY